MRITTRIAGVAIAVGALGGLGSMAGVASAATPGDLAAAATSIHQDAQVGAPQYTRGFHIYNLSSQPLTLQSITGDNNFGGRPDIGSTLQPGQSADFEVEYKYESNQADAVTYGNSEGSFTANLDVNGFGPGWTASTCTVDSGTNVCSDPDDHGRTSAGTTIVYEMPAGSTITYNGDQAQQQADVLKQLCTAGADATCTFAVDSETEVAGPEHLLTSENNNSAETVTLGADRGDTVSSTDSVDVSATVGTNIAGLVDASVTAKYGHTWSDGHSFSVHTSNPVPPYSYGEIDGSAPMKRDTGDFTLVMGNTTYHLNGVYFDSPDPDGGEVYTYTTKPLSHAQMESLPTGAVVIHS